MVSGRYQKQNETENKAIEKKIDEGVINWKKLEEKGKEDMAAKERNEIILLLFIRYNQFKNPRKIESESLFSVFVDTIATTMEKYDAEKGDSFIRYFSASLSKNYENIRIKRSIELEWIDVPLDDDDTTTKGGTIPDPNSSDLLNGIVTDAILLDLLRSILDLSSIAKGKENNPARQQWYRIFFTEDVTNAAKTDMLRFHERDTFRTMDQGFLDSYMSKQCRTYSEIAVTPLKTYAGFCKACSQVQRDANGQSLKTNASFCKNCEISRAKGKDKREQMIEVPLKKYLAIRYLKNTGRDRPYKAYIQLKKDIWCKNM